MGDVIGFPGNDEEEDDAMLVCCSECGGVLFAPMLYKGTLIFQCAHEPCGEIYEMIELQEAKPDGLH